MNYQFLRENVDDNRKPYYIEMVYRKFYVFKRVKYENKCIISKLG